MGRLVFRIGVVVSVLSMVAWPERQIEVAHYPHQPGRRLWAFVDPPGKGLQLFNSFESIAQYLRVSQRRFFVRWHEPPERHEHTPTCSDAVFYRDDFLAAIVGR